MCVWRLKRLEKCAKCPQKHMEKCAKPLDFYWNFVLNDILN